MPPPPPNSFPSVPPLSLPPLRKRKENRRCWDCIIASITVIIYTSILSYSLFFFWLLLQSISPDLVCAAETCKAVQVVISETTFVFNSVFIFPELRQGTSLKSGHSFSLLKWSEQSWSCMKVRWWWWWWLPSNKEDNRSRVEPPLLNVFLSFSLTNGGQDMTGRVKWRPWVPVIRPSPSASWEVGVDGLTTLFAIDAQRHFFWTKDTGDPVIKGQPWFLCSGSQN